MIAAAGFAAAPLIISAWVRPRKPSEIKQSIFECGLESKGDPWVQFKVQYYIYALIFVIFDLETVFLIPWAVAFNQMGMFAFVEMIVFIFVLAVGLGWAWKKGVLEWK
jgi:NADH:ubiquinone oxidoreductase subunit 3 (subunit A)